MEMVRAVKDFTFTVEKIKRLYSSYATDLRTQPSEPRGNNLLK